MGRRRGPKPPNVGSSPRHVDPPPKFNAVADKLRKFVENQTIMVRNKDAFRSEAFDGESDRAAALLLSSDIDNALSVVIISVLFKNEDGVSDLLRNNGALATFQNKISVAYASNIIDKSVKRNLDIIRLVRNAFAHSAAHMTFQTQEVSDLCEFIEKPQSLEIFGKSYQAD